MQTAWHMCYNVFSILTQHLPDEPEEVHVVQTLGEKEVIDSENLRRMGLSSLLRLQAAV